MEGFAEEAVEAIRNRVGEGRVICGLSGGVDSSVAALLVHRAIGDRLTCIFVDNGLLRSGEREQVESLFEGRFHVPLRTVDAREALPRPARRRHRPGEEAEDHRPRVHRRLRGGGARHPGCGLPRAGHALPGRHRVGLHQGPVGDHQEPPQRGRAARADEAQAGRAAARAVQGRGARARPRAGPARGHAVAAAVPGPRAGDARAGRGHRGAPGPAARGGRHRPGGDPRRRASTARSGRRSPCSCRCSAWA